MKGPSVWGTRAKRKQKSEIRGIPVRFRRGWSLKKSTTWIFRMWAFTRLQLFILVASSTGNVKLNLLNDMCVYFLLVSLSAPLMSTENVMLIITEPNTFALLCRWRILGGSREVLRGGIAGHSQLPLLKMVLWDHGKRHLTLLGSFHVRKLRVSGVQVLKLDASTFTTWLSS